MFYQERNYIYFLNKLDHYLSPVLEVYAWCLIENHFHLLVRIKSDVENDELVHQEVHHRFQMFFQSYAMSINKQEGRYGTLFQKPFKRVHVDSTDYFTQMLYYIHANPQRHKIMDDFRLYKWSSYSSFLQTGKTKLMRDEVLGWFGGLKAYFDFHAQAKGHIEESLIIEDE